MRNTALRSSRTASRVVRTFFFLLRRPQLHATKLNVFTLIFLLGHVLCATCCSTIIEKTPSRLSPVCPFCRVVFTSDAVRKIRIDFTSSGRSTQRVGTIEAPAHAAFPRGVIAEDRLPPSEKDRARLRIEARRLEDKVAKAAAKKCSVEEVAALQHEVDDWLRASDSSEEQVSNPSPPSSAAPPADRVTDR